VTTPTQVPRKRKCSVNAQPDFWAIPNSWVASPEVRLNTFGFHLRTLTASWSLRKASCLTIRFSSCPTFCPLPGTDVSCPKWARATLSQIGGAGPVGILTAQCAFARGARRVILVDKIAYRLEFAKKVVKGVETVDASKSAGETQVLELCKDEPGGGPDCVIECVGMHYAHSAIHKVEMATGMETDSPEALNASLVAVRKGGRVGVIGAYGGFANHVNLGTLMQKGLFIATGQCPVQKYWKDLLERVKRNELDPSIVITHHLPLDEAANAYKMFNGKTDEVIKVVLHPGSQMGK